MVLYTLKKDLFFIFLVVSVFGLSQNRQLRNFSVEDGLPQSQVYALTQDKKGYLWLGTQGGGIASFDGSSFKVYNERHGLASNYINALFTSRDTLFIGTNRGLSVRINRNFKSINTPHIHKIKRLQQQTLLLTVQGLFSVDKDLSIKKLALHPKIDNFKVKDLIYFDSYFWIANQHGLWRCESLLNLNNSIELIDDNDYTVLLAHSRKIIASTFNDGTYVFSPNNFKDALLIKEPLEINNLSIKNQQLWVATHSGISVLDTETYDEIFTINSESGLSSSHVKDVISDTQSNIWIATSGGGLYKYYQNNFKHFNTETGLKDNRVYAVHYTDSCIWASNGTRGLIKIDNFGIHDIKNPIVFNGVKIKTISADNTGGIWSGSDGRGIWYRKEISTDSVVVDTIANTQKIITVSKVISKTFNTENGFPNNWIRKLYVKNNRIFAATYSSGIIEFSYNKTTDKLNITKVYTTNDGIEDLFITDLAEDENNQLWYSTKKGHLGFIKDGTITHLGNVLNTDIPINNLLFYKNILFIGTAGKGIWWADGDYSTFKKLTGNKTTVSDNIYQLIVDDQGYLWAGTERGVNKIELNTNTTISDVFFFGKNEGFLGIETCLNAVTKDHQGHLWFGALYGLTEHKPSTINKTILKPTIFFEDVKLAYKSIDSINLSNWVNTNKTLQLTAAQRQISFTYKTVDIDHPNGIAYRYKLNNDNWSPWTSNATQNFSELNYGAYNFSVQSRNYRWKQSDPISFSFYIEPPLFKKLWFQSVLISLMVVLSLLIVYRYVKRVKAKNLREKEHLKLKNHLLTLEQKALRLQMNPHFVFNVLNGIKAMAKTKPNKMNETVNNFAVLLRETLINSRQNEISLAQEIKTLKHYIEVERLMTTKAFNYTINLDVDVDLEPEEILVPPMLIQPFVENAIRHGILKGNRKGELNISFKNTNTKLNISIVDNGIGIFNAQKQKTKTDHQSMALMVTKERLKSISDKDSLMIKEIISNDGHILGTSISFNIPLHTDY